MKKDNIINDKIKLEPLNEQIQDKFKSELAHIFEAMAENDDIAEAVESLIDQSSDIVEIQSKLLLLIKEYVKNKSSLDKEKNQDLILNEKSILDDIYKLSNKLLQDIHNENNLDQVGIKNKTDILTAKSKENCKKILKIFAIYQVYKVMNPNRIAGETAKDNFKNNLLRGGEKFAAKYEGGKDSDKKKYGSPELSKIRKQIVNFKKNNGKQLGR